jgi:hypothetical protein
MPAITKPNLHFDATLYTGTGSALSVTNGGFQPDLIWIKPRSIIGSHGLFDSVRGVSKSLRSHDTRVEDTSSAGNDLTAFNSNGFSVGTSSNIDTSTNGATVVAWQWKGGGTAVTNTNGTISSQVSVNQTAGFSIVSWTGNGVNSATVGHGLGAVPAMIICKERSGTDYWHVKHKSLSSTYNVFLNVTNAQTSASSVGDGVLGDLSSNTTFGFATAGSPGNVVAVNENGITNIAYCWAEIPGYSQFGSFVGNGTQGSGPFVYTGFQPKYVLIKNINGSYDWHCFDTARGQYNYSGSNILKPNSSAVELTARNDVQIDFLSNGFRLIGNDIGINQSGSTHIYAAFASAPFKYANAF